MNLGFVGEDQRDPDRTTVTILQELSDEECQRYEMSGRSLARFISDYTQFVMVRQSFDEYRHALIEFSDKHSGGEDFAGHFAMNWMTQTLNRRLRAFFTEVRMFLDYSESRLKRQYGPDSDQVSQFKSACSAAFDGSFAYRFLYKLRNYGQHIDVPMRNLSLRSDMDEHGEAHNQLAIQVDREELLTNFEWRADIIDELRQMPARFDLAPYLDELMEHLELIHVALVAAKLPDTRRAAEYLLRLARPLREMGSPCVFMDLPADGEMEDAGDKLQMNISWIPVDLADLIERLPDSQELKEKYGRLKLNIEPINTPPGFPASS